MNTNRLQCHTIRYSAKGLTIVHISTIMLFIYDIGGEVDGGSDQALLLS